MSCQLKKLTQPQAFPIRAIVIIQEDPLLFLSVSDREVGKTGLQGSELIVPKSTNFRCLSSSRFSVDYKEIWFFDDYKNCMVVWSIEKRKEIWRSRSFSIPVVGLPEILVGKKHVVAIHKAGKSWSGEEIWFARDRKQEIKRQPYPSKAPIGRLLFVNAAEDLCASFREMQEGIHYLSLEKERQSIDISCLSEEAKSRLNSVLHIVLSNQIIDYAKSMKHPKSQDMNHHKPMPMTVVHCKSHAKWAREQKRVALKGEYFKLVTNDRDRRLFFQGKTTSKIVALDVTSGKVDELTAQAPKIFCATALESSPNLLCGAFDGSISLVAQQESANSFEPDNR